MAAINGWDGMDGSRERMSNMALVLLKNLSEKLNECTKSALNRSL